MPNALGTRWAFYHAGNLNTTTPYTHDDISYVPEKDWWNRHKRWAELVGLVALLVYTSYTSRMYYANRNAADTATSAANTARDTLVASQRP